MSKQLGLASFFQKQAAAAPPAASPATPVNVEPGQKRSFPDPPAAASAPSKRPTPPPSASKSADSAARSSSQASALSARTSRTASQSSAAGSTPSWSPPVMSALTGADDSRKVSFSFLREKRDAKGRKEGDKGYDPSTISIQLAKGEKLTPAMQQYWDIKKNHQDVVIFFKMGKFYELFEEDALLGHRELDLAFMGKEAPHVGFPEAALPKYADKLVALGHKVGIVEQMETPKELEERNKTAARGAKDKAVRRELCTILTTGTAAPTSASANYLLSVTEDTAAGVLGVCFVDVATGCVSLGQCLEEEGKHRLRTLVAQLQPAEVLVDATNVSSQAATLLKHSVPTCNMLTDMRYGSAEEARQLLLAGKYFGGNDAGAWPLILREAAAQEPPVAFAAFGGCLKYLQRLLLDRQLLPHAQFSAWRASDDPGAEDAEDAPTQLVVDGKTLENLEVFNNTTDGSEKGTLFSVLDRTATAFGKRELRKWLCAPLCRLSDITERQDAVAALLGAPDVREALGAVLKKMPDLERLIARVHSFSVEQASNSATHYSDVSKARMIEFLRALTGMAALDAVVGTLQSEVERLAKSSPRLAALLTRGEEEGFPHIDKELDVFRDAFDWERARKLGRTEPKEGQDPAYEAALAQGKEAEAALESVLKRWRTKLRDPSIAYWTPGGSTTEPFQLTVSEETLKKMGTPEGFEQMSSKKGCRRFWTDEIRSLVDDHLAAKAAEETALASVARRQFGEFSGQYVLWRRAVACAAELDCLVSLALVSAANGMCRPSFVEAEPFLNIRGGVNVCVQASLTEAQCIPNDIVMGNAHAPGTPRFLLVTGPNMGGKSTILRQACLTVLMAQLGCWVAAESCSLSPVDRIFTRVGANDAIMAGLSTFRVELEETSLILRRATPRSLVILDELGRGTATFDGMAIAYGALRHLVMETRCLCLFATHYHALAREFEHDNPFVALYHMACSVDDETRVVTFLYRFLPGACSRSHGIHVARLAGLPASVLEQAAQESAALEHEIEDTHVLGSIRQILSTNANSSAEGLRTLQLQLRCNVW